MIKTIIANDNSNNNNYNNNKSTILSFRNSYIYFFPYFSVCQENVFLLCVCRYLGLQLLAKDLVVFQIFGAIYESTFCM